MSNNKTSDSKTSDSKTSDNKISNNTVSKNKLVERFCEIYTILNANNIDLIEELYQPDIVFKDPLHQIEGLTALKQYLRNMYLNLSDYSTDVVEVLQQQEVAYIHWNMSFIHPKLKRSQPIEFTGITRLELREKIFLHQDFFDVGAMLYEHIPFLGKATRWIKQRAGQ